MTNSRKIPVKIVNFKYPRTEIGGLAANLVNLNRVQLVVSEPPPFVIFAVCVLVRRLDIFMVLSLGKELLLKVPDNRLGHRSFGKVYLLTVCCKVNSQTLKTILVYVVIWKLGGIHEILSQKPKQMRESKRRYLKLFTSSFKVAA